MTRPLGLRELAVAPASQLEALLRASQAPPLEAIIGFEWRGFNTGLSPRLLGIQKFIKGFYGVGGEAGGYNVPVTQNGVDGPWQALPAPDAPKRYAFYRVSRVDPASVDRLYPAALLLDYGAGLPSPGTPALARRLRDYLVAPDPAIPDLLLGKAYLALSAARLPSNFFILERLRATAWTPREDS
jgi:hypothetical protein